MQPEFTQTHVQAPQKPVLRQHLLRQRRSLVSSDWQAKSDQICQLLRSLLALAPADSLILGYFSIHQEPDLSGLFHPSPSDWSDLNSAWGFPRCVDKQLHWHRWSPGQPLLRGQFGLTEPDPRLPRIQPEAVRVMLVPCVACDRRGYRLGYGGGFYDRLLASPAWSHVLTIGVMFEFAWLDELAIEPWDWPLDAVCTEVGVSVLRQDKFPH